MAGLLLFVILMCFFHEIQGQALPPPNLRVDPPVITETVLVTLYCVTPSYISVSRCHFYTGNRVTFETSSCHRTLTGTELLKISSQSSPSEVQVACYYTAHRENVYSASPFSHMSSITIQNSVHEIQGQALHPPKLTVNPPVITETDSVTLNCQTPSSSSVTGCYFFTATQRISEGVCVQTLKLSELLKMVQRLPAEVKVRCCYNVKSGDSSPHSDPSTITMNTLPPPKLVVDPPVITETDLVTLYCQTRLSVSVSHCYFYTVNQVAFERSSTSCHRTLTGTELLKISHQSSPSEVQVKCFYSVQLELYNFQSQFSDISSITIQSVKPEMSLQSFEGEHIFFICSLPGSVKRGTGCNLYFGEVNRPILTTTTMQKSSKTKQWFCRFTVPFDDLLRHLDSVQQKDVSCDFKLEREQNSLSPRSDRRSLTEIVEKESSMMRKNSTFTVTAGSLPANPSPTNTVKSTVRTTLNSTPGGNDADVVGRESSTMRKNSTFTVTAAGSDVTMSSVSTPTTSVNTISGSPPANPSPINTVKSTVKATVTPRGNDTDVVGRESSSKSTNSEFVVTTASSTVITSSVSTTATSVNLIPTTVIKVFISVAGFGASVAIVFLVLVLRGRLKRRTERSFSDTKANITDDSVCLRNINHGEVELTDNNVYSLITSVPGADCSTGFEKLSREEARSQDSDIYHLYDTIPELPPASDQPDMLYSLLQAH